MSQHGAIASGFLSIPLMVKPSVTNGVQEILVILGQRLNQKLINGLLVPQRASNSRVQTRRYAPPAHTT